VSISTMTNLAIQRRDDDLGGRAAPRTLAEAAEATGGNAKTENLGTAALKSIATYIPTEVIALYLAAIAAVRSGTKLTAVKAAATATRTGTVTTVSTSEIWLLVTFVVLSPVVVWLVYAGKVKTAGKKVPVPPRQWPSWEMTAAAVAFAAWAFAFPQSPFARFSWYTLAWATFVVLAVSTFLGLLAPVLVRRNIKTAEGPPKQTRKKATAKKRSVRKAPTKARPRATSGGPRR
jgi:hypothetical protein